MASRLGMAIRTEQANDRIDAALARLTSGLDVPDAPVSIRDTVLRDTLRLEWIATALEAIDNGESDEDTAEMLGRQTRDELNAHADEIGLANPESYRTKAELVDAILYAQDEAS